MRKRISFLLVAVLLLATLIPALPIFAADETTGGETVANTFDEAAGKLEISTAADYKAFFEYVFVKGNNLSGKTVTMLRDITLNDTTDPDWYTKEDAYKFPTNTTAWVYFSGTFDGNGHTLRGAIAQGAWRSDANCGIFPHVLNATIKNLNVDGFYVQSTNTSVDWTFGKAGIGGLVGFAKGNVTIDNCTLKNGIVASASNGYGLLGSLMGVYNADNTLQYVNITDTTVTNVQLIEGESPKNVVMGGIFGGFVTPGTANKDSVLDVSGSVFQPVGSMDETPLQPVGVAPWHDATNTVYWRVRNDAIGISHNESDGLSIKITPENRASYPDGKSGFGNNAEAFNKALLSSSGCYGANALPTVRLDGTQPSKTANDVRFVGLVAKSVIDDKTIDSLGFRLTVGEKTVDESKVSCTKVYTSILEDGETRTAPDGYYYFTFVVTDVNVDTAFTYIAVANVGDKVCTTSAGVYTYSPAASSES